MKFSWRLCFWLALVPTIVGTLVYAYLYILMHDGTRGVLAAGDALSPLRSGLVLLPFIVLFLLLVLRITTGPIQEKGWMAGVGGLTLAIVIPLLPKIDSGHTVDLVISGAQYTVPWRYEPHSNGRSVRVRVYHPGFTPLHGDPPSEGDAHRITLFAANDWNRGRGGDPWVHGCEIEENGFRCQWEADEVFYSIMDYRWEVSGPEAYERLPDDKAAFFADVADFFDGFKVADSPDGAAQ